MSKKFEVTHFSHEVKIVLVFCICNRRAKSEIQSQMEVNSLSEVKERI